VLRQRWADTLAPEAPEALSAHVRGGGGAAWVTIGSTRKPTPASVRSCLASAFGHGSPPAFGVEEGGHAFGKANIETGCT
jgi:hypothetical protein